MDLTNWRVDYQKYNLKEKDLTASPFELFKTWFDQAIADQNPEPNAMTLTTAINNRPSSRVVLLKEVEQKQFVFYTNYQSQKANEIAQNPHVFILFYWPLSQRQIRIEGIASPVDRAKNIAYFDTRPESSRISAIASPQSHSISSEELLRRVDDVIASNDLTCPLNWGGYAVVPSYFEFWQGQPGRLHDRIIYKKTAAESWEISRLAP